MAPAAARSSDEQVRLLLYIPSVPLAAVAPAVAAPVVPPDSAASFNPFRVFVRHRNFRIFLIGQTMSLIGTWMQTMAEGWLALELTNSAFLVGLVAVATSIPILLFSLPAGAIVDRADKLRLVRIAQGCYLVEASLLWLLTVTHHIDIHSLLALAFVSGTIASLEIPARQSMYIDLVGREDLPEAIRYARDRVEDAIKVVVTNKKPTADRDVEDLAAAAA